MEKWVEGKLEQGPSSSSAIFDDFPKWSMHAKDAVEL